MRREPAVPIVNVLKQFHAPSRPFLRQGVRAVGAVAEHHRPYDYAFGMKCIDQLGIHTFLGNDKIVDNAKSGDSQFVGDAGFGTVQVVREGGINLYGGAAPKLERSPRCCREM